MYVADKKYVHNNNGATAMPLSDTKLRNIEGKPYSGKPELADRDGLGVRISKKGTIAFQYRFRWNKKEARLTVGRYPDVTLKQAREFIPEIRGILAQGVDPRLAWKPGAKLESAVTSADCVVAFQKKRYPMLKESSQIQYESVFKNYFTPLFEGMAIDQVDLDMWLDWFDEIAEEKGPKLAGSLLKSGKALFNWCKRRNMIKPPAILGIKMEDVGLAADEGTRVLTLNEAGSVWRGIDQAQSSPSTKGCQKLCILFACRQSEIGKAHRNHFNMTDKIWTVPKELSKTNKPIRRPIHSEAEKVIRKLWEIYGEDGYLIPATYDFSKHSNISTINKCVRSIRARLLKDKEITETFRMHDFRRTLSTRLSELDVMPHVTEKMLGHELGGVMRVYNKHDWLDDQRAAYELWSKKVLFAAYGKEQQKQPELNSL